MRGYDVSAPSHARRSTSTATYCTFSHFFIGLLEGRPLASAVALLFAFPMGTLVPLGIIFYVRNPMTSCSAKPGPNTEKHTMRGGAAYRFYQGSRLLYNIPTPTGPLRLSSLSRQGREKGRAGRAGDGANQPPTPTWGE